MGSRLFHAADLCPSIFNGEASAQIHTFCSMGQPGGPPVSKGELLFWSTLVSAVQVCRSLETSDHAPENCETWTIIGTLPSAKRVIVPGSKPNSSSRMVIHSGAQRHVQKDATETVRLGAIDG